MNQNLLTEVMERVGARTAAGLCFSSGEVAKEIRTADPSFAFSARTVGNILRDAYFSGSLPPYGTGNPPYMAVRVADGLGRTPAGTEVFVYGPDVATVEAHPFEVDIPAPPSQAPVTTPSPTTPNGVQTATLTVAADGRIYIPASVATSAGLSGTIHKYDSPNGDFSVGAAPAGSIKAYTQWPCGRFAVTCDLPPGRYTATVTPNNISIVKV